MAAGDDKSVLYLNQRLRPVPVPDAGRLQQLIADLASDRFAVREKATQELQQLGEVARPAIEQALANQPALEQRERLTALQKGIESWPRDGERLRANRSVRALEYAGTPEARQVLDGLARGAPGTQLTYDAKAFLERMAKRLRP